MARGGRRDRGTPLPDPHEGDRDHGTFEEQAHAGEDQEGAGLEAPPQAQGRRRQEDRGEEVAAPRARELRSRRAVAAALAAVEALGEGRPLRLALAGALADDPSLGPKERRHVAVAARGVARWLRACDAALVRAGAPRSIPSDRALLRYLAWRVAVLGEPASAVAHALRLPGPRRPRTLGDDALREVAGRLPLPGPSGPLAREPDGTPSPPPPTPPPRWGCATPCRTPWRGGCCATWGPPGRTPASRR